MGNCNSEKTNVDQGEFYGNGPSVNRIRVLFGMLVPLENTSSRENEIMSLIFIIYLFQQTRRIIT